MCVVPFAFDVWLDASSKPQRIPYSTITRTKTHTNCKPNLRPPTGDVTYRTVDMAWWVGRTHAPPETPFGDVEGDPRAQQTDAESE